MGSSISVIRTNKKAARKNGSCGGKAAVSADDRTRLPFPLCGNVWKPPVFALVAADVHRTSAFRWVLVLRLLTNKEKGGL